MDAEAFGSNGFESLESEAGRPILFYSNHKNLEHFMSITRLN